MSNSFNIKNTIISGSTVVNTSKLPIFNSIYLNNTPIGSLTDVSINQVLTWNGISWSPTDIDESASSATGYTGSTGMSGYAYTGITGPSGITGPIGPTGISITGPTGGSLPYSKDWLLLSKNINQIPENNKPLIWESSTGTIPCNGTGFKLENQGVYLINVSPSVSSTGSVGYGVYEYYVAGSETIPISPVTSIIPINSVIENAGNMAVPGNFSVLVFPTSTQNYHIMGVQTGTDDEENKGYVIIQGSATVSTTCTIVRIE